MRLTIGPLWSSQPQTETYVLDLNRTPPAFFPIGASHALGSLLASSPRRAEMTRRRAIRRLEAMYPGRGVILTDTGTTALRLALGLAHAGRTGAPVVAMPAFACPDIASGAIGAGYGIALYDLDPTNLYPDVASLKACLEYGATTVLVVHFFGRITPLDDVARIAKEYGAMVVEDAAQHAGARMGDQRAGSFSPLGVLSFGRGKGLNAGGGGALIIDLSASLCEPALVSAPAPLDTLSRIAMATATELLSRPMPFGILSRIGYFGLGTTRYVAPRLPRQMDGPTAHRLLRAVDLEATAIVDRQRIANIYSTHLKGSRNIELFAEPPSSASSGWPRFPFKLLTTLTPRMRQFGISPTYPRVLSDYQEVAHSLEFSAGHLAGSRELARATTTAPTHRMVTPQLIGQIVSELRGA